MRIELHIDRVVLDGLPGVTTGRDGDLVREALHAELTRLLTATPPPAGRPSTRTRRLSTPDVQHGDDLGANLARSIHTGLINGGNAPKGGKR